MQASNSPIPNRIARSEDVIPFLNLDQFLPYRLSIVSEAVSQAFATQYERRFGITVSEWRIMAVLGTSTQSTQVLIDRTRMDRVKVSRAAISLEAKGLVARAPRAADKRALDLRLSPRGVATYRQIVPIAHALQEALVGDLGAVALAALDAILDKLLARAGGLLGGEPIG